MSLIEIPDPPGYKVVAYRRYRGGDAVLHPNGMVIKASGEGILGYNYPILEPVEVWRDATLDDLKRAPCKARFRCGPKHKWEYNELGGVKFSRHHPQVQWITLGGAQYHECQVLEVPHD